MCVFQLVASTIAICCFRSFVIYSFVDRFECDLAGDRTLKTPVNRTVGFGSWLNRWFSTHETYRNEIQTGRFIHIYCAFRSIVFMCEEGFKNLIIYTLCAYFLFFFVSERMQIMTRWKIAAFCATFESHKLWLFMTCAICAYRIYVWKLVVYVSMYIVHCGEKYVIIRLRMVHVMQIAFNQVIIWFCSSMARNLSPERNGKIALNVLPPTSHSVRMFILWARIYVDILLCLNFYVICGLWCVNMFSHSFSALHCDSTTRNANAYHFAKIRKRQSLVILITRLNDIDRANI